ncbi:hypothetical protein AOG26_20250 [Pseudoalteromonas sp. UCD-33C]|nr:hypothetical protein AOG26_20250 [Pseudoalteromonas sp. UCD-33C]
MLPLTAAFPAQFGVVTDPAVDQVSANGGGVLNVRQWAMFAGVNRVKRAVGAFEIGRQQLVEVADNDQGHVVGGVPGLAQLFQLVAGQVLDFGPLGAFEAQLDGKLTAGLVAEVLAVQQALQV